MCFVINPTLKPSKKRVVYKVVRIDERGQVGSIFNSYEWSTGTHVLPRGAMTSVINLYGVRITYKGFHVYLNKRDAVEELKDIETQLNPNNICGLLVVLKLKVNPNDCLYVGFDRYHGFKLATYKKVTVPEDQPDIEWY